MRLQRTCSKGQKAQLPHSKENGVKAHDKSWISAFLNAGYSAQPKHNKRVVRAGGVMGYSAEQQLESKKWLQRPHPKLQKDSG